MARTYVITGAASGMGASIARLLASDGHTIIGVDMVEATLVSVIADISTPQGRSKMIAEIDQITGGIVDGLLVCAGTSARIAKTLSVNFFGAVATLEGLQPMLARGTDPRAVVITSYASTMQTDEAIIKAALEGNEQRGLELAEGKDVIIYTSSKAALALWCRRHATRAEWAGSGILLNMVAPGMVDTPMIAHRLRDPVDFEAFKKQLPLPLDRYAQPEEIAMLLRFLSSPDNSYLCGQHIFIDGGSEALKRPDHF